MRKKMAAPMESKIMLQKLGFLCKRCCLPINTAKARLSLNSVKSAFTQRSFLSSKNVSVASKLQQMHDEAATNEDKKLQSPDFFGVGDLFTVSDLFNARVHLGHKDGMRNQFMKPYLFGNRLGQDIFDLDRTATHLTSALNITAHLAYRQALFLFICRNRQNALAVEETAKACGEYAHCRYWNGGMFTNSQKFFNSTIRLPDACIFIGTQNNVAGQHLAVVEAAKMQSITIGVVDSDSDPRLITYPVPGNDDSPVAVKLYCDLFSKAIKIGKETAKKEN